MLSAANRAVALGAAADDKATQAALDSDNPRWITEDTTAGALTRNIESASGDLATTTKTGDTILQLTNIHGDNCTPAPAGHQQGPRCLGLRRVRQPAGRPGRYNWLGAKQRCTEIRRRVEQLRDQQRSHPPQPAEQSPGDSPSSVVRTSSPNSPHSNDATTTKSKPRGRPSKRPRARTPNCDAASAPSTPPTPRPPDIALVRRHGLSGAP
ncbi:hypothetical protein ABT282_36710 [Streptomyces sp. NPDC000927]|uniref:hypothetical protein n=1 Tax=Streptomyces sp. NPDC000927 TaxID=3154371 RepID=UPI003325D66C